MPEWKDIGLLQAEFGLIKHQLKPNPEDSFNKIKKRLPPEIKWRVDECWKWIVKWNDELTKKIIEADEFVK